MTKPFDEAQKLKGICRFCVAERTTLFDATRIYSCSLFMLGIHKDYCTKEDYLTCTFNEINLHSKPQPKPSAPLPTGGHACEKPPVVNKAVPGSASYTEDLKKLVIDNEGQLYWLCQHYFKKLKKDVAPFLVDYNLKKEDERLKAWLKLVEYYAPEIAKPEKPPPPIPKTGVKGL